MPYHMHGQRDWNYSMFYAKERKYKTIATLCKLNDIRASDDMFNSVCLNSQVNNYLKLWDGYLNISTIL